MTSKFGKTQQKNGYAEYVNPKNIIKLPRKTMNYETINMFLYKCTKVIHKFTSNFQTSITK